MTIIDGLSAVADRYELFLIDQWGVLHNGVAPHEGAIDALKALREAGKKIVILSNSGKRLALTLPRIEDADFILNAGTRSGTVALEAYEPILQRAIARELPMICANPDFVSVAPDGNMNICPGATARRYEEIGGQVDYRGKPHAPVYERCLLHEPGARPVLAIGDSLYHDIGGANAAAIDSLFIASGIHIADAGADGESPLVQGKLDALYVKEGQIPTYAMKCFGW